MKRLSKVILLSLIGFTRLNEFRFIPVLLGSTLLSLHLHAGEATASDALRKIISLDQGWRFQEGWFTIPKRTLVSVWRYRLDEREEASADVMAATGLDTSGPEWGYDRTPFKNKMGDPTLYGNEALCYLSAYSEIYMGWSATCKATWKAVAERPWIMGRFVWSGFDYQREPSPFVWPGQAAISTQFGIMDFCGFPKDSYWYYKSWWGSEPVLHVFPHWNWQGKEGEEIPVWVYSNCGQNRNIHMKQSLDLIVALLVMQSVVTWAQMPEKSAPDPSITRIVFLGDSITEGVGVKDKAKDRYARVAIRLLAAKHPGITEINLGQSETAPNHSGFMSQVLISRA